MCDSWWAALLWYSIFLWVAKAFCCLFWNPRLQSYWWFFPEHDSTVYLQADIVFVELLLVFIQSLSFDWESSVMHGLHLSKINHCFLSWVENAVDSESGSAATNVHCADDLKLAHTDRRPNHNIDVPTGILWHSLFVAVIKYALMTIHWLIHQSYNTIFKSEAVQWGTFFSSQHLRIYSEPLDLISVMWTTS